MPGHQKPMTTAALSGDGPEKPRIIARIMTPSLRAAAQKIAAATLTATVVVQIPLTPLVLKLTTMRSAHPKDGTDATAKAVLSSGPLLLTDSAAESLAGSETSGDTATMVVSTPRISAASRPNGATSNASCQKEAARSRLVIALETLNLTLFLPNRTSDVRLDSPS